MAGEGDEAIDDPIPTTISTPFIAADTLASKEEVSVATGMKHSLTWPWNLLSRYPLVDVPIGFVERGMPVGMQVIGNTFDDLAAFRFAHGWENCRRRCSSRGACPPSARRAEPAAAGKVCRDR
ncbi:MAG: amidase family protein [Reyranellaceae bacterium]